ncbi:hypothetical protein RvY_12949 [Ramazzottius varieornatus]|uniref:Peptidase S1 domain-containing protein n=1 Tax=Ramazzottius varieornatus TaxID=947166 RepID=A0A1D1VQA9_RAMVA|nr:hypothetical protein RvY_12949 [Ramazzottius varieornatus]
MIIFLGCLLLFSHPCNCKYGKRYFYDPFGDWDKEYYDASLEDLRVAAPPPPRPPSTPVLNAQIPFSLPSFQLPGLPFGGPPISPGFTQPYRSFGQPNFPGLFEGYNYGGPVSPGSRFDQALPNFGYGQFRQPLGPTGFGGDYQPYGLPSRSLYGNINPGFNGINPGYNAINSGYGGISPQFNNPNIYSQLNSPLGFGPQINLPPPFDTSGPINFGNQPWRPPSYQPSFLPFSNYEAPGRIPNYNLPLYPPQQTQNLPVYLPLPSQNLPAVQFNRPSPPLFVQRPPLLLAPTIGRRCKPRKYPGVTGVCSNYFDIINRRTCLQLSVDSKTLDCPEAQWCCFRAPSVRELPSASQSLPVYQFTTREINPSGEDYFRAGSKSVTPVIQEDSERNLVVQPEKHVPVDIKDENLRTIRPEVSAALERGGALRVVPRTLSSDSSAMSASGETCGKSEISSSEGRRSRILRGDFAEVGEFCWQVALFHNGTFICGGALVSRFHVVTSAHCVSRFDNSETPLELKISLGTNEISQNKGSSCQQAIPVGSITVHPSFDSKTLSNDIAVIRLTKLARMDHCTCTLCLPGPRTPPLRIDSMCLATGFGESSLTGSRFGRLRSSPVQIVNSTTGPASCQRMLDKYSGTPVDYKLDSTMFCTISRDMDNSVTGGKGDLCSQDYGSPLICALDSGHPDQWTLIGLATWSLGCGTTAGFSSLPSIFTHVKKQMDWISLNLE